jgi:hypothetical protein
MISSPINILNKINLPIKDVDEGPSVMWLMASCAENRDTLTFRDHSHTFFELHLVIKGSITYGLDGVEQTVGEGELFFVPPRKMHKVISCDGDFMKMTVAFELSENSALFRRIYHCSDSILKINDKISKAFTEVKVGDFIEIKFGEKWVKFEVLSLTQSIKKEDAENMVKLVEE